MDLTTDKETQEIPVGLQPTALYLDGSALFVANSNDDSLSVIDTSSNTVAETVHTNPVGSSSFWVGSRPGRLIAWRALFLDDWSPGCKLRISLCSRRRSV